ncbi:LysM domain-containing protein [Armillaria novae-zelandiae]|uniref:LysM domain-containing protein n=1 Tax=Armillaria novae-zelandiae TaxID=153914 RepID=A0AA39UHE6_9AGAR|nr:LysM domain-containing protein [Armillaria novae-zelandiae]
MFARTFTLIAIIVAATSVKAVCDSGVPGDTYVVKSGDTCWAIATDAGIDVARFQAANPGIKCESLAIGQRVCVPSNVPGKL